MYDSISSVAIRFSHLYNFYNGINFSMFLFVVFLYNDKFALILLLSAKFIRN